MRALLIIDVQIDFLPGGALAVPAGDEIIAGINQIQSNYDLVVATQDWHPTNHKSFASNHSGRKPFETISWMGYEQVLWPNHCVQGTKGAELSETLDQAKIEAIFRKGTNPDIDSYSGFFDNGHLKSTALSAYLHGREVQEIHLVGLAADYCVYFSAIDAIQEGFETVFLEDLTRAISPEGFALAKAEMIKLGVNVAKSGVVSRN